MTNFVFVHGGLHGSWCWEPIAGPLRADGHVVELVDLPGRPGARAGADVSRASYRDTVESAVRDAGGPVVLVAHSLGGLFACLALERIHGNVARVFFVNSLLVPDGEAPLSTLASFGESCWLLADGALDFAADGSVITIGSLEAGITGFYNGCDPQLAAAAAARLCPEPVGPLALNINAFSAVPKTYLGSREDHVVPWQFQQRAAADFGAEFVALSGDHSPFLSVPDELLVCLSKA
jgi:pimeloyl-ACP methyl ester carboxylesterase